jgi:hypothetical protein
LLLQVALPVLLSKVPAQPSASHDCVSGGQVGVGVADDEVVDNSVDVVLSEVDIVLSEADVMLREADDVVLDGMATKTEEGHTKYWITPGVGSTAGHNSTPRLSRNAGPSLAMAVLLQEFQQEIGFWKPSRRHCLSLTLLPASDRWAATPTRRHRKPQPRPGSGQV